MGDRVGRIAPGLCADLVAFDLVADGEEALFEALTAARPAVRGVWIGGRRSTWGARPGARTPRGR